MSFSPGQKAAVQPLLFGGPVGAVCAAELAWAGKGRRPRYCSKACSSKADRAREKEKRGKALATAAGTPRGESGLPDGLADDPAAAELLALGDRLARADRLLLLQLDRAARDGDAALGRQSLADVLHAASGVMARRRELAEGLLAAHPTQAREAGQPAAGAGETPRGETPSGSGDAFDTAGAVPAAVPDPPRPTAAAPSRCRLVQSQFNSRQEVAQQITLLKSGGDSELEYGN
ncbi:hypothetical protein ABZ495_36685, partial [Kitasatospora sp. NPDC005748]